MNTKPFENRDTLVTVPGIYANLHYPYLLVKVTAASKQKDGRGHNIDQAGYVAPVAWGVDSNYWRPATSIECKHYRKSILRFSGDRIQYRIVSFFKELYQWIITLLMWKRDNE